MFLPFTHFNLLFVCLGNICRSPAAESIFLHLIHQSNLSSFYTVRSAGTSGFHQGQLPDSRMRVAGSSRGLFFDSLSSRVKYADFAADLIVVMDDSNFHFMMDYSPDLASQSKIVRMTDFCTQHSYDHVPDPYYSGQDGFELVLDILFDSCTELLRRLELARIQQ